jgi:hypothetical protein
MNIKLTIVSLLISTISFSQVSFNSGTYYAKEFNKDQALYKAKEFVMTNLIGVGTSLVKFDIDPLAATSSGELTSLVYNCDEKKLSGLLLGFYGNYWNESGVVYQGYAFKNLPENTALEMFSLLNSYIDSESKYLSEDSNNNNMFFKYNDMTFLIYKTLNNFKIRIFWNGFDSEWEQVAFTRTQRRFERKIKK